MAKLKPYNPQVKCPKCGCDDVKVGYCDGCYEHGFIGEHFDRTCQRCFYGWAEKCQPTTAPEPPKDTIVVPHSIDQDHVRLIGKRVDPTVWLEAKLPTEVEALYSRLWIAIESAGHVDDATLKALMDFHIGLAALWPKAGQVGKPSPQPVRIGQIRESEDVRQAVVKVTHDPHYHAALDHDLNRLIDIVASEAHRLGDQPKPVTDAEQLMVQLAGCSTAALGLTKNPAKQGDYGWSPAYQDVLDLRRKYDALQSPVTAEKLASSPETVMQFVDDLNKCHMFICHPDGTFLENEELIAELPKAFPAFGQGRLTVSKEQWERLLSCATSEPTRMVAVVNIKAWLKEIGMEVAE